MTVRIVSLGCPRNQVDSELLAGELARDGWRVSGFSGPADIVLVNTCGFIEPAARESIDVILEAVEEKNSGRVRAVVVAGCLPKRYRDDDLQRLLPEVDAWLGPAEIPRIGEILREVAAGEKPFRVAPGYDFLWDHTRPRLRLWSPHVAYVRISEGCRHGCTYCLIPRIRGPLRSRPLESLLAEVESLARDKPVPEIVLVAQDTTSYGIDLYGRRAIAELVRTLARTGMMRWLRLLYAHPVDFPLDLLDCLEGEPAVCPYLDIPLQHVSDRILKAMGREIRRAEIEELIAKVRKEVPGITLRTTMMVGFPGETDEEFQELLGFVAETRFERLGAFIFSPEEGTPAAGFPEQLPPALKQERLDRLMSLQAEIAFDLNESLVGREMEVLVDGVDSDLPGYVMARSRAHAPEVDDGVLVPYRPGLEPGVFTRVRIVSVEGYSLVGEEVSPPAVGPGG